VKIDVMRTILRSKFQSAPLRRMLLETGDAKLIEGNSHGDRFWGCVLDVAEQWDGENWLGELLMELRRDFKNGVI
jgi:ribA/ribD-fused uncharacterized protein